MNIYLIGDSTLQYNDETTYPQVGWGQIFKRYLKEDIKVINLAKNGASTKSFIDANLFKPVVDNIKKGDLLIIEFGHNDEKVDINRHTDPYTSYIDNLLYFINTARKVKATPVLLSSIARRKFINRKITNSHGDYPKAMEELAKKENVMFIDLNKITMKKLEEVGELESKKYFMNFDKGIYKNYINGLEDNTHLREEGAILISEILKKELKKYFDIFK